MVSLLHQRASMRRFLILFLLLMPATAAAEIIAGVEGGSDRGYAYLTWMTPLPLTQSGDLLFWTTGSYHASFSVGTACGGPFPVLRETETDRRSRSLLPKGCVQHPCGSAR